jgi:hypothetical protein
MKAYSLGVRYKALKAEPLWMLLASPRGPWIVALLQSLFGEKKLVGTTLHDRLERELETISRNDPLAFDNPGPAKLISQWVSSGWLLRQLPPGGREEEYELTVDALQVLQFLSGVQNPTITTTESRLSTVIEKASELAQKTDSDPSTRLTALYAQKARLDREIEAAVEGRFNVMPDSQALEGVRDLLALIAGIPSDFQRVRDSFASLNKDLRRSLTEEPASRSGALEALFSGRDVISESDPGRTFTAFWSILRNPDLQQVMRDAIDALLDRPFAQKLSMEERRMLDSFFQNLIKESHGVQSVQKELSFSLRNFVKTKAFDENRAITEFLRQAKRAAQELIPLIRPGQVIPFELTLTTSNPSSVSNWTLYDPMKRLTSEPLFTTQDVVLDLEALSQMVRASEINMKALEAQLRRLLIERTQVSIGQIFEQNPAAHGLATVAGYLTLAYQVGQSPPPDAEQTEVVSWTTRTASGGRDWFVRARIPKFYFLRGCLNGQ